MHSDIAIADLLSSALKQWAASAALGACECTSHELRELFAEISQAAIRQHEQLTGIITRNGWYVVRGADLGLLHDLHAQMEAVLGGYNTAPAGFVTANDALMESGNM
jgi:spore coat protein CotF